MNDRWVWALRFIGVGWWVAACIILGALLGHWLDGKLHTAYWLLFAGVVVGTAVAFIGLWRMVQPWMNEKGKK